MTKAEIKRDITTFVLQNGSGKYGWYVGIAAYPKDRLFNEHMVSEYGTWIYRPADTEKIARDAEVELLEELNAKGAPGGGSNSTTWVYAYQITSTSKE